MSLPASPQQTAPAKKNLKDLIVAAAHIALLKRFPKFRVRAKYQDLLPLDAEKKFPALADRIRILNRVLMPIFKQLDLEALKYQNRYYWLCISVLLCELFGAFLGNLQIALGGYWGAAQAATSAILVGMIFWASANPQKGYLHARLAAEQLRSLFFVFLGAFGQYFLNDLTAAEALLVESVSSLSEMEAIEEPGETKKIAIQTPKETTALSQLALAQYIALYQTYRYKNQLDFIQKSADESKKARKQAMWAGVILGIITSSVSALELAPLHELRIVAVLIAQGSSLLSVALNGYVGIFDYEKREETDTDTVNNLQRTGFSDMNSVVVVEGILYDNLFQWGQLLKERVKIKGPTTT